MKFKQIVVTLTALLLIVPSIITPVSAATSEVKVTIPKFTVELNGKKIDNVHALYPTLTYKDITYFPMTLDYANALGISVQWNSKTGLVVQSPAARMPLKENKSGNNSLTKTYKAQIPTFPVKVNDQKINNATEKYPLLVFRDITYFPMTWHFTNDLFHWKTDWNAATGYHIRSNQVPVLYNIVYDDASFLYVSTGTEGTYKISKALLDGKYTRISKQENDTIMLKLEAENKKHEWLQVRSTENITTEKEDFVYYKDQKLLSLEPYLKQIEESKKTEPRTSSRLDYSVNQTKLDESNTLLILRVFYLTHIPAPYTPHEDFVFVIHNDIASKVAGYTQWPDKLFRNSDGSSWISSYAPSKYDISVSSSSMLAQLALIDKNGLASNINEKLKAKDIDVLYADNQALIIKAYNDRLDSSQAAKTDGFYSIDTHLTVTKLADSIPGISYVDQNKQLFVLDPDSNTITNVTAKKSHTWWDYELRADL